MNWRRTVGIILIIAGPIGWLILVGWSMLVVAGDCDEKMEEVYQEWK